MGEELKKPKSFAIPKRFIIIFMASLATAIQYTIRSNLSVTIVAMVNNTQLTNEHSLNDFESLLNNSVTMQPTQVGCPVPEQFLNSSNRNNIKHHYKGPKLPYSESTQGFLLGAFFYGYIMTHVFGGQVSAYFGGKKTIAFSILLSAIFTLATPFSTNFDPIWVIILRTMTGMAQGVMSSSIYVLFANWVPQKERSFSFSFFMLGSYFGSVVTMPLSGYLCESGNFFDIVVGWYLVFYVLGSFALIGLVFWCIFVYETPLEHPTITHEELKKIFIGLDASKEMMETINHKLDNNVKSNFVQSVIKKSKSESARVPWLKLFASKDVWVVAIAKFCVYWSSLLIMAKLPSYLDRMLHLSMAKNSFVNAMVYTALCVSAFIFGYLSDLTIKRQWMSKLASRKLFESIALFGTGTSLILIPLFSCEPDIVCCLMILSSISYAATAGGDNVIMCDLTMKYSGSIYGIANAFASIPGFLAPIFVGFLLNIEESIYHWNVIFITSALIAFFGGFVFLIFASVDPIPNLDNEQSDLENNLYIKPAKDAA